MKLSILSTLLVLSTLLGAETRAQTEGTEANASSPSSAEVEMAQTPVAVAMDGDTLNGYTMPLNRTLHRGSIEMIEIPQIPFFDFYGRTYVGTFIIETRGRGRASVLADDTVIGEISDGPRLKTTRIAVNRPTAKLTIQWLCGPRLKLKKIVFLPLSLRRPSVMNPVLNPGPNCPPTIGLPYSDPYCPGTIHSVDPIHLNVNRLACLLEMTKQMLPYDRQAVVIQAIILATELQSMIGARSGLQEVQTKLTELLHLTDGVPFQEILRDLSQRSDPRAQSVSKGIRYSIQALKRSQ
jgi:hypothetical protein